MSPSISRRRDASLFVNTDKFLLRRPSAPLSRLDGLGAAAPLLGGRAPGPVSLVWGSDCNLRPSPCPRLRRIVSSHGSGPTRRGGGGCSFGSRESEIPGQVELSAARQVCRAAAGLGGGGGGLALWRGCHGDPRRRRSAA